MTALKPDQSAIRKAVAYGVHRYWDDAGQQAVAYSEWRDRNFEGECRQISHGNIIDYVTRSVLACMYKGRKHVNPHNW